ncbi:Nn.00g106120.m01.CDS01 [Neocucurbitaria sp. VM-36]
MHLLRTYAALALYSECAFAGHRLATRNATQSFAANLLHESLDWLDRYYDNERGYLFSLDAAALTHDTRASVWYAAGLLARNEVDDAEQAMRIVSNVIGAQFKNESEQWFGDYQIYPEEPTVGTEQYPPVIYNSWDPNWRGFIGTTFVVMLEEFPHLISQDVQEYMLESLYNTTIGDSYRVGGVDDDNLYPAYSNPSIMRAFVSGWVGRRVNDTNMTTAGEAYAEEIIDLFTRDNTLSEFNSGTYAGVSLFALTLWAKYMDEDSLMGQYGGEMIRHTWTSLGQLYNANLKNVAGPWDRSYGFDMNKYLSILALQMWTLVGKENAPINKKPYAMGHKNDFAISPLIAILAPFHNTLVPNTTLSSLSTFPGTHTVTTSAFSPPYDTYPRNITAWLSSNLTIGAESFAENVVGGPAKNPSSFNPAVAQWLRQDGSVGWLSLYAQVKELNVEVGEGTLELTYPQGNSSSGFSFLVGTNGWTGKRDVRRWDDVEGVKVNVSGTVDANYTITFNGMRGGAGKTINDFEFWNFTYSMPKGSQEIPRVRLEFELA